MLVGYNTNVSFKGNVYHVQTEDNGLRNPVIVTLLYMKGTILASKKTSYANIASAPDYKEKVRELMKEQHKTMIRELISGKYTEQTESQAEGSPESKIETENPEKQENQNRSQITKSLDDILIDYIIKRKD